MKAAPLRLGDAIGETADRRRSSSKEMRDASGIASALGERREQLVVVRRIRRRQRVVAIAIRRKGLAGTDANDARSFAREPFADVRGEPFGIFEDQPFRGGRGGGHGGNGRVR
jgi:hypothetical protein